MKRIFTYFLALLALAAIGYPYRYEIQAVARNVFVAPCSQPITYSINSIDSRFNVSKQFVIDAFKDAEDIWEKPLGKNLFQYQAEDGAVKVNLVFDNRALVTNKLAAIDVTLKGDQATYDALKNQYAGLKTEYTQLKADYDNRLMAFNERSTAYEQEVKYWNGRGGARGSDYDRIQSERASLQTEANSLQSLQAELNDTVNQVNNVVKQLNKLASALNLNVDTYNAIDASRGDTFEEGLYQSDGIHQKIDVYEWDNRQTLVRLIAHELGHALGLGHVADPNAIMYEINKGSGYSLTVADTEAVKKICGIK